MNKDGDVEHFYANINMFFVQPHINQNKCRHNIEYHLHFIKISAN